MEKEFSFKTNKMLWVTHLMSWVTHICVSEEQGLTWSKEAIVEVDGKEFSYRTNKMPWVTHM